MKYFISFVLILFTSIIYIGCQGKVGPQGINGTNGTNGENGTVENNFLYDEGVTIAITACSALSGSNVRIVNGSTADIYCTGTMGNANFGNVGPVVHQLITQGATENIAAQSNCNANEFFFASITCWNNIGMIHYSNECFCP